MFLCRESPASGTTRGASTVRLAISRTATHQCRQRATTTNTPTRERTSTPTPTPMLTLRHFSSRRLRTLPLRPCCCAAARSPRPPRSDGCASS
jgi:hypothetical protein